MAYERPGDILRRVRFERGLTQSAMAEVIDISLRYYQSLEKNEQDPGYETIIKIVANLVIEPGEFFGHPRKSEPIRSNEKLLEAMVEVEKEKNKIQKQTKETERQLEREMLEFKNRMQQVKETIETLQKENESLKLQLESAPFGVSKELIDLWKQTPAITKKTIMKILRDVKEYQKKYKAKPGKTSQD